jgi:hypothetical protein
MQEEVTISAQQKWAQSDKFTREKMLAMVGQPACFAKDSWSKLKHMAKVNLETRKWTA